jgi:hypothetical protein
MCESHSLLQLCVFSRLHGLNSFLSFQIEHTEKEGDYGSSISRIKLRSSKLFIFTFSLETV